MDAVCRTRDINILPNVALQKYRNKANFLLRDRCCVYMDKLCLFIDKFCLRIDRLCLFMDKFCLFMEMLCLFMDKSSRLSWKSVYL